MEDLINGAMDDIKAAALPTETTVLALWVLHDVKAAFAPYEKSNSFIHLTAFLDCASTSCAAAIAKDYREYESSRFPSVPDSAITSMLFDNACAVAYAAYAKRWFAESH